MNEGPLDPLSLPLHGTRLIEASAGTGKTWTIAALYLRLVLGHGAPRAYAPGEILVMTFTKAATRELSERIRQRLLQATACLRGQAQPAADDTFLQALMAHYAPRTHSTADLFDDAPGANDAGPRAAAAWRLAHAAEAMDEAAVHTIDAWCQRMLREHAFDSACLFDEELQADESAMRTEAVHDYWRQQVYPLSGDALAVALAQWPGVDALRADTRALLDKPLPAGAGEGELGECIARASAQRAAALAALKQGWVEREAQMRAWLEALWQREDKAIDGRLLGPAHGRRWLDTLAAWAADPERETLELGTGAKRLSREGVMQSVKSGLGLQPPDGFRAFDELIEALPRLPAPATTLRAHAAARVAERLQQLKAQAGTYGFADMLERLNAALDEARQGPRAKRLRVRILDQYPVALVDEFQDTSPVQLSIFDRLYRIAENDASRALLLIGDPKQAIYGFRGADIHSYLSARRATLGRHHVLGTNHRSSRALVAAVNGCFEAAEARAGEGAFMFRELGGAAADGSLPFLAVAARGRDERFVTSSGEVPALVMCLDTELRGKVASRELYAALCAEQVVKLLDDSGAGFVPAPAPLQRLRPADLAVLVRSGIEAAAVRTALRQRGVASVYLSDTDSVLASDETHDLLRLLQAVAAPRDVRLARAALASSLVGLELAKLVALASDDERFDARCELLRELHLVWQTQGVLAMLRQALHGLQLPARWLAGDRPGDTRIEGERRLTNVLHLAELLQAESARLHGEQALIRWLAQQIDDARAAREARAGVVDDAQVLRLESDADLVKVVTVHQSKGLEYPVVLLPFAAHVHGERGDASFAWLPDAEGHRRLVLAPDAAERAAADKERRREDLRLLYVALTRARHSLWVGVSALRSGSGNTCQWHESALGYLVSGPEAKSAREMAADLHALAAKVPGLQIEVPQVLDQMGEGEPRVPVTRVRVRQVALPLRPALPYEADFDRTWSVSSYSALVKGTVGRGSEVAAGIGMASARAPEAVEMTPADLPARTLLDDEPAEGPEGFDIASGTAPLAGIDEPWHRFPRGALVGNFLHGQLEWLAGEGFALDGSPALQRALVRRCERQGWGHRADDVLAWLRPVCSTPLPAIGAAPGTALARLHMVLPEMEFWLPSDGLRARRVDELCRHHLLPGRPRPPLPERALRGMLMGFADLVFAHEGRHGVLDYKSNALGAGDAGYTPAAMEAALLEHRYDVQAALYLLALHRLLKRRLAGAYAPARHLQGAVFLFLRGVRSASAGCLHLPPPVALIEALDALLQPTAAAVASP